MDKISSMAMALLYWGPQSLSQHSRCGLIRAEQIRITSPWSAGSIPPSAAKDVFFSLLCPRAHPCLLFSLVSSGIPRPLSATLLCSHDAPSGPDQSVFSPPQSLLLWLRLHQLLCEDLAEGSAWASFSQGRQYPLLSSVAPGLSLHTVAEDLQSCPGKSIFW